MDNGTELDKVIQLKKQINENVAVNDELVCGLCDKLIFVGKKSLDWQSVAFGYVWRADYYFYVASNMQDVARELDQAQEYIDKKNPTELLEKYYTLRHVLYENTYEIQSAFHYTLKALDVAERAKIQHRIGANYGNLATYFLEYGCFEGALIYTEKALGILRSLPETKPRLLRLLLSNLIMIYIKLKKVEMVKPAIQELSALAVEKSDLKLYVDYGYLLYYSAVQDSEQCAAYLEELYRDGLLDLPNRVFIIEILTNTLEAVMSVGNQEKSMEVLEKLEKIIRKDEYEPLLTICKLKIQYIQLFGTTEELRSQYREYYSLYLGVQAKIGQLKGLGLCAKVELNDVESRFNQSMKALTELHDLVNYDELTKVYTRRYMQMKQEEVINSGTHTHIGFVLIDVDYFKEYNDFYGHVAGDQVLKQVASCLKENAVEQMVVFRYGGDEFGCLCWDLDNGQLQTYVNRVEEDLRIKGLVHLRSKCANQVTLSIGFGSDSITTRYDALTFFDQVDKALYNAKNHGRNNAKSVLDGNTLKGEAVCVT